MKINKNELITLCEALEQLVEVEEVLTKQTKNLHENIKKVIKFARLVTDSVLKHEKDTQRRTNLLSKNNIIN